MVYNLNMEKLPEMDHAKPEKIESPEVDSLRKKQEAYNNWLYARNTARMMTQNLHHHEYVELDAQLKNPKAKDLAQIVDTPETPHTDEYLERLSRYSELKIATSKLQAGILDKMRNDKDFWNEPLHTIKSDPLFLEISDFMDEEQLTKTILRFATMHDEIETVYEHFPDHSHLYEHVFARAPHGKIEVVKGPVSLYFRCFDLRDYAWIHSQSFFHKSKELTDEDLVAAERSGGCAIATAVPKNLEGSIIAENASSKNDDWEDIMRHEEEHAIRRVIKKEWYPEKKVLKLTPHQIEYLEKIAEIRQSLPNNGSDDIYLDGIPDNLALQHLNTVFREANFRIYARGADEILAYFKDGMHTASETYLYLTTPERVGGIYDYFEDEYWTIESISDDPNFKKLVRQSCDKAKDKYHTVLKGALEALRDLYGSGKFSRDEVIAMFDKEELVDWPKITKRILTTILK